MTNPHKKTIDFRVSYGGRQVLINHCSKQVSAFLDFLFGDIRTDSGGCVEAELSISQQENQAFAITCKSELLFNGTLSIQAAAVLFDCVIFHLLNTNNSGIALHAGAVMLHDSLMLVPGQSGAGKSSLIGWLAIHGWSYATDELIFFDPEDMSKISPFTRPICLKSGTAPIIKSKMAAPLSTIIEDSNGAIIPFRLITKHASIHNYTPKLILFPAYQKNQPTFLEKLSAAQASTLLLTCCANARNLPNHGFKDIVKLARSIPVYRLSYENFSTVTEVLEDLIAALDPN